MAKALTLQQRKLVGDEIAKEFRKWKRRKGEPTAKQRQQIVAIGFSKARAKDSKIPAMNPDLGMAILSGATAALMNKAMSNPALLPPGGWYPGAYLNPAELGLPKYYAMFTPPMPLNGRGCNNPKHNPLTKSEAWKILNGAEQMLIYAMTAWHEGKLALAREHAAEAYGRSIAVLQVSHPEELGEKARNIFNQAYDLLVSKIKKNPTGIPFSGSRAYRPATRHGRRVVRGYTRLTSDMRRAAKAHEARRREYGPNPLLMTIMGNPSRRLRKNPYVVVDSRTGEVVGTHGEDPKGFLPAMKQAKRFAELSGHAFDVEHTEKAGRTRMTPAGGRITMNPGRKRKITMSLNKFVQMLKAKRDPRLIKEFVKKMNGYKKWTHGTLPKTVTLEAVDVPGVNGLWLTYDAGKEPEALYMMPKGAKRKGAWRHPWDSMPSLKHDPEAGVVIKKLRGKSKITDFYHK